MSRRFGVKPYMVHATFQNGGTCHIQSEGNYLAFTCSECESSKDIAFETAECDFDKVMRMKGGILDCRAARQNRSFQREWHVEDQ